MPTRILSWGQLVLEEDPNWARDYRKPWIYEMSNRRRFYARDPLYGPYADTDLIDDGGVVQLRSGDGWPTSDAGLSAGMLWNNGYTIAIVPGAVPFSGAPRLMFPGLTASQLLRNGGANLPVRGFLLEGQIWNNGGLVCIAQMDGSVGFFILDQSVLDGGDVLA